MTNGRTNEGTEVDTGYRSPSGDTLGLIKFQSADITLYKSQAQA